ncbi:SpoIIE family protein phosphatase [Nonomuraea sp. ATR24]|uniref:SpoIIE family protein phosphatase n=1 Tax=Nonomuraea TaxID=83681 RepID=UPI001C5F059B|nr:SpoIIE family protein phosphatase [Nonomuraea ceibae]
MGTTSVWIEMLGRDLRVVDTGRFAEGRSGLALPEGSGLRDLMAAPAAKEAERRLREVLATGEPVVDWWQVIRPREPGGEERWVSMSAFRMEDHGEPSGVLVVFAEVGSEDPGRRLELLYRSAASIGASLDVVGTAEDLAGVLVPGLADLAAVDLSMAVLNGEEPSPLQPGVALRFHRCAVSGPWPEGTAQAGWELPPIPELREMQEFWLGQSLLSLTAEEAMRLLGDRPELVRLLVPENARAMLCAPLRARGMLLGAVTLWRAAGSDPFDDEDTRLLAEIGSRAALGLDNARRYAQEHRAAVTLQRSLLPQVPASLTAAETAGAYVPAGGASGVGGDWFDVIPQSSLRVAFVVGDVVGHGLRATAAMARLRTAIQALADLDLSPDELLAHMDDLVVRLAEESDLERVDVMEATCLYAVFDPVTRRCVMASAGHPPPVVVPPGGPAAFVEMMPGPPLGVGGMPFEPVEVTLPDGAVLALYTNGLVDADDHDLDGGMDSLRRRLDGLCRPDGSLREISDRLMTELSPESRADDVTLLLARTHGVPEGDMASWEFRADPSIVAQARMVANEQLSLWGLDALAFTTELIVSELVTNAIMHAGEPVGLRLIRDRRVLVCEVSDPSSTQPRLRRAREVDEGGRGLFLVAQLAARWGSRYTPEGKTIWTEQPIG